MYTKTFQHKVVYFEGELSRLMEQRGVTVEALAKALEITETHMKNVISGSISIDKKEAEIIASVLGIPFDELFGDIFKIT